jgi:hypothetical protein
VCLGISQVANVWFCSPLSGLQETIKSTTGLFSLLRNIKRVSGTDLRYILTYLDLNSVFVSMSRSFNVSSWNFYWIYNSKWAIYWHGFWHDLITTVANIYRKPLISLPKRLRRKVVLIPLERGESKNYPNIKIFLDHVRSSHLRSKTRYDNFLPSLFGESSLYQFVEMY